MTKTYALFGNPVANSRSPAMHNAAFKALGIDAVYIAFNSPLIDKAIHSAREKNFAGASVTIPHKVDVISCIDEIDETAANIGAVNTLVFKDGKIKGYNTDGIGAVTALREAGAPSLKNLSCLLIGNGGAARAIAYALVAEDSAVTIAGRTPEKAAALTEDISKKFVGAKWVALADVNPSFTKNFDVIINATSVGMEPDVSKSPIEANALHSGQWIFDIVYKPDITKLLAEAQARGCKIIKGSEMLLYQGTKQFELWTGQPAPIEIMRQALSNALTDAQTKTTI